MNAYAQTIDRPLERAVITVQRIIPPKAQGKPAAIKASDGMSFGVWPDKLGAVREGDTCEIEFDVNGVYRNIKMIRAAERPGPAPAQFTNVRDDRGPPPPRQSLAQSEPQRQTAPATQNNSNGNGNYFRPTSPKDARRMWLCSQLNAMIESRQVDLTTEGLIRANNMLMDVYDATIGREDA